jgi:sugar phosphate permease
VAAPVPAQRSLPAAGLEPAVAARLRRLRWLGFGLVAAAYVVSYFHRIAPAAIAGELRAAFGASGAQLGALAATYFSVYTVMQVPTGVMVDELGPRRIVAAGGLVAGAGAIAFGRATTLAGASVGRALVGLGVSVTFVALLKYVSAWFREREFATMSGLVMFLGNSGAVLSAAPLAWVLSYTSWRTVFVLVGLSSFAGAALTWLLVRDDPRQAGLPSVREVETRAEHSPQPAGPWYRGLVAVMRNPSTWPGFFVNLGIGGSFFAWAGLWAVPHLTGARGMSRSRATAHTTVMLLAFALSSLLSGRLSDRLARRRAPMIALGLLFLLSWLPWPLGLALPPWASLGLFALMGFSASAFTLSWASAKEVNPPSLSGTAMAVVNTGVFLGPTACQPLVGWVLDRAGWQAASGVMAGFAALGFAAAFTLRETHGRNVTAG